MSRREIVYVRSLSKSALGGKGTIELRRNRSGEIFYSTRHANGFATWHLYPKGEEWLTLHGFGEGDMIDLSVSLYLHKNELSHTGGSKKQRLSPQSTGTTTQVTGRFDWAAANGVDQRLGKIRGDTVTIRADGLVTTSDDMDAFLPKESTVRVPAQSRRPFPESRRPQDDKLSKEIAQLVESTREFERNRTSFAAEPVVEEKRRKEPARFASHAPGPIAAREASRTKNRTERQQPTTIAMMVSDALGDARDADTKRPQPTNKVDDMVTSVMAKLAMSRHTEPKARPISEGPLGVPRKLQKKATRRKKN